MISSKVAGTVVAPLESLVVLAAADAIFWGSPAVAARATPTPMTTNTAVTTTAMRARPFKDVWANVLVFMSRSSLFSLVPWPHDTGRN